MRQIFGFWYALLLIGGLAVVALARANDGTLLVLSFEGDAVHMAQIVLRMVAGDIPHQDFLTPLGAMAFLPIVWLVNLGAGVGSAFAYASVLLSIFMLPALYWAGISRFNPSASVAFALLVVVQLNSLVHGGLEPTVAVSMYYNNWCWAISAIIVALAVLPNNRPGRISALSEPVFVGIGMGFLVLTKMTFAMYLAPAVIAGFLVHKQPRQLVLSLIWCFAFLAIVTTPLGGIGYWQGYIADLAFVAQSSSRAQPGDPLALMVLSPVYFGGVIALITGFVLLRQARLLGPGLVFLLLSVGWVLVSHQNWQNDPHWLVMAGLILFAYRQDVVLFNRFGWPLHGALGAVGVALFALGTPFFLTQMQSLLVHSGLQQGTFSAVSEDHRLVDLKFRNLETGRFLVSQPAIDLQSESAKPALLNGETLPDCERQTGLMRSLVMTGAGLDEMTQTHGKQVLNADWLNGLWLFSKTEPLQGGAPWYYGGLPGLEAVDFVVVPLCPMGQAIRRIILDEILKNDVRLEEVARNELFILLKRVR